MNPDHTRARQFAEELGVVPHADWGLSGLDNLARCYLEALKVIGVALNALEMDRPFASELRDAKEALRTVIEKVGGR